MHNHIRGDTFDLSGEVTVTVNGARQLDLTGWIPQSQIRDTLDNVVATLNVTWLDAAQSLIRLTSLESTAAWPVGRVAIDIQLTSPEGEIVSTRRAEIQIEADVTR